MAKLHIDSLSRLSNRKDIREALKRMPDELPATYDALMTRILSQDKGHVDLAMTVLMWITHAKEPLSPRELQHAVAFPPDSTELDEEALPSIRHLISLCAGIVVVDRERNVIRLVHYTTEHYFQDVRKKHFPDADAIIARTCLNYFCLVQDFREKNERDGGILSDDKEDHEDDPSSDSEAGEDEQNSSGSDDTVSQRIEFQAAPLLNYAIIHWGGHARRQEEMVQESILTFLGQESRLRFVRSELEAYFSITLEGFHVGSPKKLHTAAIFGLTNTVSCLLATGSDLSMGEGNGFTSLFWATLFGHESTVRLLLEKGANVNAKIGANGGTTLHVAAIQGHEEIVSLLLKSGANVNAEITGLFEDKSHTALDMARANRHEAIVRVLLENKASSGNNAGSGGF